MNRRLSALIAVGTWLVWQPVAGRAAVLNVNSLSDSGSVGDATLTLREALQLAAGPLPGLSGAELAQITGGTPGAASADTIRFALGGTVVLEGDGTPEALPALSGGGDTLDGEGNVVLSGSNLDPGSITFGLRVTASNGTVRGLAFEDVPGSAVYVQPSTGGSIVGTRIVDNRFTRAGLDAIRIVAAIPPVAGATVAGGLVDDTVIQGNVIEVATPGNRVRGYGPAAINLMAAYGIEGSITGASITNVTIAENTIRDVFEGIFARAAVGTGLLDGNVIDGLTVRDNVFERVNDQTLYVGAATVQNGGTSTQNAVRNLRIAHNTFRERVLDPAAPYLGGGPFVSGGFLDGCATQTGTSSATGDVTEFVEITDNVITDRSPYGVYVQGAQSCGGSGGTLTQSAVRHVTISGNTIESCDTGISLTGGSSFLTQGPVDNEENTIDDVTISNNTLATNGVVGLEVIGGVSNGGAASRNHITGLTASGNTFSANRIAVALTGGVTIGAGDAAPRNELAGILLGANTIVDSVETGIMAQGSTLAVGADTAGNSLSGLEISDNVLQRNGGAAIQLLGVSAAAGATPDGNLNDHPRILRNVIQDTVAAPDGDPQGFGIRLVGHAGGEIRAALLEKNDIARVAAVGIILFETTGHTIARNIVSDFGRKAFVGKKKKNKLIKNRFSRHRR